MKYEPLCFLCKQRHLLRNGDPFDNFEILFLLLPMKFLGLTRLKRTNLLELRALVHCNISLFLKMVCLHLSF